MTAMLFVKTNWHRAQNLAVTMMGLNILIFPKNTEANFDETFFPLLLEL